MQIKSGNSFGNLTSIPTTSPATTHTIKSKICVTIKKIVGAAIVAFATAAITFALEHYPIKLDTIKILFSNPAPLQSYTTLIVIAISLPILFVAYKLLTSRLPVKHPSVPVITPSTPHSKSDGKDMLVTPHGYPLDPSLNDPSMSTPQNIMNKVDEFITTQTKKKSECKKVNSPPRSPAVKSPELIRKLIGELNKEVPELTKGNELFNELLIHQKSLATKLLDYVLNRVKTSKNKRITPERDPNLIEITKAYGIHYKGIIDKIIALDTTLNDMEEEAACTGLESLSLSGIPYAVSPPSPFPTHFFKTPPAKQRTITIQPLPEPLINEEGRVLTDDARELKVDPINEVLLQPFGSALSRFTIENYLISLRVPSIEALIIGSSDSLSKSDREQAIAYWKDQQKSHLYSMIDRAGLKTLWSESQSEIDRELISVIREASHQDSKEAESEHVALCDGIKETVSEKLVDLNAIHTKFASLYTTNELVLLYFMSHPDFKSFCQNDSQVDSPSHKPHDKKSREIYQKVVSDFQNTSASAADLSIKESNEKLMNQYLYAYMMQHEENWSSFFNINSSCRKILENIIKLRLNESQNEPAITVEKYKIGSPFSAAVTQRTGINRLHLLRQRPSLLGQVLEAGLNRRRAKLQDDTGQESPRDFP